MDKFLIYNGAGWCNVHIGNFDSSASYLTDVPLDCLDAAKGYIINHEPIRLYFDAEGYEFDIISDDEKTILHHNMSNVDDKVEIVIEGITPIDLIEQIYKDISEDIDGWCEFLLYNDEQEKIENRNDINNSLVFLKMFLDMHY